MLTRYRLIERIRGGGYADVFKAEDSWLRGIVAIKILRDCSADNLRRFKRERDMLLTHKDNPYVIDLLDSDLECETPFLVLEFSEPGSLQQYILRVHWTEVVRWMRQVARALDPIHARGDWHRDIKPGNLLLFKDRNGTLFVKVSDFGLAQRIDNNSGPMTHSPFGTKGYIDPVAQQTGIYNSASDVYSLGRTVREVLTGNTESGPYPDGVPVQLQLLLNQMTRLTRDLRPTASAIQIYADALLQPQPAAAQIEVPVSKPNLWGLGLLAAGIAAAIFANKNTYDSKMARYRNAKGQFASGMFW